MQGTSRPDRELLDAAALCRQLVPEGSVEAFLADHRQELFPDEMFADLFPSGRGRPSVPADVVATVMVLQSLEGRSDREACRALQTDIAWKAAAALALPASRPRSPRRQTLPCSRTLTRSLRGLTCCPLAAG